MSDAERAKPEVLGVAEQNTVVQLDLARRPPIVRIHLLGSMRATTYVGENILPRGRKARAVLGYLCLNPGERVARSRLSSLLWDRVSDRQARSSLRQALLEISTVMGPLGGELISADLDTVMLDPRLCWIDALAVLSSEPLPPQSFRSDLVSMCTGELLEDISGTTPAFDQWLLAERTRFTSRLRALYESEMEQLGDAPATRRAALARNIIAFEATHEGASRILMRALAEMGERAQALREYERCRKALKDALDVEPSMETRALSQALRTFAGREDQDIGASATIQQVRNIQVSFPACNRLRVGVRQFKASRSPNNENLAFCLSQEIAVALARFRWFDVIAPEALPRPPSSGASGSLLREKQLHYIVDGDLSGNEEKFQIDVRLLDVRQEARPVWSDRFELTIDALDRVNDLITAPVVARIDPVIFFIEGQQTRQQHSGATGLVLRAVSLMYDLERKSYEEAGELLRRAMEADPENAKAIAWGAYWYVWYVGQGWAHDPASAIATAQELVLRAIRIDPDNAEALGIYAHICSFLMKDFDSALHYFERALRLNPNLAFTWALSAPTYCYVGEPDIALQHLDRYRDLAPFDPYFRFWEIMYAIAYTFKGDYEKAVSVARRALRANREYSNGYKPLIASLGHLGRRDEAAPYIEKLLSLEPNFTVARFGKVYPFQRSSDRERYMRGLVLAGVPEG
jgi:DNA-binding SARP family transcriptional activator/Tfp pilus assembly protein PilF